MNFNYEGNTAGLKRLSEAFLEEYEKSKDKTFVRVSINYKDKK